MNYSEEIAISAPIVGEYDVIVCGGGPAGFIAAIAAARNGSKTALIEQLGFLGGMATAGFVTPISVFTYNNQKVIGGIPWEFIERLQQMGGALIEQPLGNVAFEPELYKLCCQRMVLEAGIDLYMHSYITDCTTNGEGHIKSVIIQNKNGAEALLSKVFIDCTGDADLAYKAGAKMLKDEDMPLQPLSSYFILGGVDTDSELIKNAVHHNKQGVNCHCLPVRNKLLEIKEEVGIPEFGGPWFCTTLQPGVVTVNMTRTAGNACDNRDYTKAECTLREQCFQMAAILRDNFKEFKNSYIQAISPVAGIRETRRVKGLHIMTGEEYVSAYRYDDSVSRGAHPIDIHVANGSEQNITYLKEAAYVPYRSLVPESFDNLLVAGRCLSADKKAFASMRVQASCMGTGQAAGVAAAQCAKLGVDVRDADVVLLVEKLREIGAMI